MEETRRPLPPCPTPTPPQPPMKRDHYHDHLPLWYLQGNLMVPHPNLTFFFSPVYMVTTVSAEIPIPLSSSTGRHSLLSRCFQSLLLGSNHRTERRGAVGGITPAKSRLTTQAPANFLNSSPTLALRVLSHSL